jgi:hypothetical protein
MTQGNFPYYPQPASGRSKQSFSPPIGLTKRSIDWSTLVNSTSVASHSALKVEEQGDLVTFDLVPLASVSLPQSIIDKQKDALVLASQLDEMYGDPIEQLTHLLEEIERDGKAWREVIDTPYE